VTAAPLQTKPRMRHGTLTTSDTGLVEQQPTSVADSKGAVGAAAPTLLAHIFVKNPLFFRVKGIYFVVRI